MAANIHLTEPEDGRWTHGFVYGDGETSSP